MDVTAVLIVLLLPPAMLAVVMGMAGYEDLMLPAEPLDPCDPVEPPAAAGPETAPAAALGAGE
ncbi:hypothetical protein [Streptomyces fradiae]|uniref:hypothetical protein n=1 Tax=Streptomyces fradiae TaxID=1906 RepID=UPI0029428CFB|nr:hypothetical protein [Streptomyces fradiae]WOI61511.1 hypothetical protein RYQ63_17290 [Streptomyces fradiae]